MGQDNAMCGGELKVIGLSAKMGCGKTTLANLIMDMAPDGGDVVHLAFGDQVKHETAEYFGFPLEWCYSQEGKRLKFMPPGGACIVHGLPAEMTVREAMQWYGTDFRRAQDPLYWIKAFQAQLITLQRKHGDKSLSVVVDDVRFPDEADACLANGYCFRVEPFPGWQTGPHAGHVSETSLDRFTRFTAVYHPEYGLDALTRVAESIVGRVFG